jgi:Uma2 family endonuclease
VVSPHDLVWEIDEKVAQWLAAGVRLVWVVHPRVSAVHVYRAGGAVSWLRAEDELSGEEVLPGFRCRVDALFPPWAEVGANAGAGGS